MLLFSIGFFVIAITTVRLVRGYRRPDDKGNQRMWLAVETAAACLVCQAPMIYSMLRKRTESSSARPLGHTSSPQVLSDSSRSQERVRSSTTYMTSDRNRSDHHSLHAVDEEKGEKGAIIVTSTYTAD